MESFICGVGDKIVLGAQAHLVEEDKMQAWAETSVRMDPDVKWILGNYIEADQANSNGYIFPMPELDIAQASLPNKPLNMLHHARYIVGCYAATNVVQPDNSALEAAAAAGDKEAALALALTSEMPRLEALSAMWKNHFPEEYQIVERANEEGSLFYSMEATPQSLTFPDHGGVTVPFDGLQSDTYPTNEPGKKIVLHDNQFHGGALIVPPIRPGWTGADAKTVAAMIKKAEDNNQADVLYSSISSMFSHLDAPKWEAMMVELLKAATV